MMEEAGPHHYAAGPHQVDGNLHQAESRGSQHGNPHRSPERREGREGSVRTTHTTKSRSLGKSHVSHAKNHRDLQHEIDGLKRELRYARREHSPPCSEPSFVGTDGASYRRRSKTLRSETFSYEEEQSCRHKRKSPPSRGLGNNTMNKALSQVSKSPFTRNIENAILPRRFHQPTFTLYDGRSDPVKNVSHFSQKMAIYSRDEALMCKIFPSSLGPVAMRWFNGLRANFIESFKKLSLVETQVLLTDGANCRVGFWGPGPTSKWFWPKGPQTMNFQRAGYRTRAGRSER